MLRHVIEVLRGQRLQKTCTKHMVCFELRNWRLYAWVETDNSQLQNPFEGMKATGLGASADAYTAEKPWLVVLLLGKMRNRSLLQIEFLDPYYSPYIYICLFTRGYLFFNSSLYVFHPMWVVFWGRPGPAKWFSFPSCLPEPSSWLSGCCVKWTDRNLETFLLSFCYPHVGVVFKFGLVSEKTHFGVIYFKHVLAEENHGEFGWHYFFNIKNFRMHHLRKTNSWSCGVLHGIFPVDGVSHGRLHWVWNCFVFWNSSNPNGRSLRIVRVFGTYRKLPFFLSIYIYICHLNFVLKLAPHLLQSGIAG